MPSNPTHGGPRPGSGRPPSGRQQITLRLSVATIEKLDRLAPTRLEQAALIDELVEKRERLEVLDEIASKFAKKG